MSICPSDLPYECGIGICTTDESECDDTLKEMADSARDFFLDLTSANFIGAIQSGSATTEAFAIAHCE